MHIIQRWNSEVISGVTFPILVILNDLKLRQRFLVRINRFLSIKVKLRFLRPKTYNDESMVVFIYASMGGNRSS